MLQEDELLTIIDESELEEDTESVGFLALNPDNWNFKITERSKNRMKIQIKLNRDETESFKNFTDTVKPKDTDVDTFCKYIFLTGIETLNVKLSEKVKEYVASHKEELTTSGVNIDIDSEDIPIIREFPDEEE